MKDIKNNQNRKVRSIIILEGLANIVVFSAKVVVGFYTGSSAILSDALHSLTDIFNNIIAYFVQMISSYPPDQNHPYGHKKFETLAVFVLATILSVVAVEMIMRAYQRIGDPIIHSNWALIVMFGVLLVNLVLSIWENYWAKRLNSRLLSADAKHTLSDVLITISVIVGWQLSVRGYPILDFIFSIVVSMIVFYLAYKLFKNSIPILVDEAVIDIRLLENTVEQIDGVIKLEKLRSRTVGNETFADMVIKVAPSLSLSESHKIADKIEEIMVEKYAVEDVVIHIEPNNAND